MQLYHKQSEKKKIKTSDINSDLVNTYIDDYRIEDVINDNINVLPFWRPINNNDIKEFANKIYKIAFYDGFMCDKTNLDIMTQEENTYNNESYKDEYDILEEINTDDNPDIFEDEIEL